MSKSLNLAAFWKAYFAVFLSFVTSRLLLQTDILMLTPLGLEATAAFAVPGRLMVIDAIIAFALGPVISVAISRETALEKKYTVIKSALGLTLLLSLLLVGIGLLIYPLAVDYLVADSQTKNLAQTGVLWMIGSVPIRMLAFIASMCLFACKEGRRVSYIYGVTLTANAALNWLLIYYFKFGFVGSYIATCLVSTLQLAWFLYLLVCLIGEIPFSRFKQQWLKEIAQQIGAEWLRLVSWQAEGLVILAVLASRVEWLSIFSAFGVISEFSALLLMPLIALMRTSAMQVGSANTDGNLKDGWTLLKPIRIRICIVTAILGVILFFLSDQIGTHIYHLENERLVWWNAFMLIYGIALPGFAYSHLIHGCYQACGQFARIAAMEIAITWFLFMPLLGLALNYAMPLMFFFAYVIKEVIVAIWLRYGVSNAAIYSTPQLAK